MARMIIGQQNETVNCKTRGDWHVNSDKHGRSHKDVHTLMVHCFRNVLLIATTKPRGMDNGSVCGGKARV